MLDIALNKQLRSLSSVGALKATTRKIRGLTRSVSRLMRPPLPGGIASFEDNDDSRARLANPFLQVAKLDLELQKLLLVTFAGQLSRGFRRQSPRPHEPCRTSIFSPPWEPP